MHVYGELYGELTNPATLSATLSSIINQGVDVVPKDITENGTYTAPSGKAYSPVNVNVPLARLKMGVIRPDAELVEKYTYDKNIVADEHVTFPSYTGSNVTLLNSVELTPAISRNMEEYDYYVLTKMLTIPTYSISTAGKGMCDYVIRADLTEYVDVPPNQFISIFDNTKMLTSRTLEFRSASFIRMLYYTSPTGITVGWHSVGYGVFQTPTDAVVRDGNLVIKSPTFSARGNATYFSETYMNAVADVRFQYVIEVYRVPKDSLNIDGWGLSQLSQHILDCVNTHTHKLT